MLLYDENRPLDASVEAAEGIFREQATPAHYYAGQNDFNVILEDMMSGAIPFNTKQPYPVIWRADIEQMQKNQQQQTPPFEGPYRTINGVEKLFR